VADERATVASPDPSRLEGDLLSESFWLLLATGEPVPGTTLASNLGLDDTVVEDTLRAMERAGRIRRLSSGEVVGSLGLTIEPSPHELLLVRDAGEPGHFFTWCALDAVGIIGALGMGGRLRSVSPQTGAAIELEFVGGQPTANDVVLFLAEKPAIRSVIDDWCPLVNFFEHADAASVWAAARGVTGEVVPVTAETTMRAADMWRPRISRPQA
jgi:hypothetical protein